MSVEIKLLRADRVYAPNENLTGSVLVSTSSELYHQGISIHVEGIVNLQLSARSVGLFEAFYSSLKPLTLVNYKLDLVPAGNIPAGGKEFPFDFKIKSLDGKPLYESYHGVYVNIQYNVHVEVQRGMLAKTLKKSQEFIVEILSTEILKARPLPFEISPETLQNVKHSSKAKVPEFLITGALDFETFAVNKPLTGELVVKNCTVDIKSIELQLVRVETTVYAEGEVREATEIQNIQIAEGNVVRGLPISIHMLFPRLFTCITTITKNFRIEFEANIIVLFADGHMVTENFPIKLIRSA